MADMPIVPPVPADVLKSVDADVAKVEDAVSTVQKWDKNPTVAAALHVVLLLVSALYMRLPASDVAVLGSVYSIGSAYFVTVVNALKAAKS